MLPQYRKKVKWLILISMLVKLIAASLLELGNDEVYYWTYALQPAWNHFDHPPMVGWMIRITTLNLNWVSEVSLRLGSILSAAISTWILFKLGKLLVNERMGWYAALIYTCSIYTGFIAGLFILPDSPQMVFWTAALYLMAHLFLKRAEQNLSIWMLLGLMIGLAVLCKVHALYLWAGFGLFLLLCRKDWLLNWRLYAALGNTALCMLPIVYWNVQYDFITYRFHSERVSHTSLQWDMLGREIAGEILYQNPLIFLLLLISLIAVFSGQIRFGGKRIRIWILCMSLPMILLFWGIALFNPTLPHWSGPAYIPLFLVAALYLEQQTRRTVPVFITIAGTLLVIVLVTGISLIRYAPTNFGSHAKENFGEYCPTLDLSGWKTFGREFGALVTADRLAGTMKADAPILVDKWFPGGHLEFYAARTHHINLIGVGELQDLHQFAWLNQQRKPLQLGADAYCIVPSNLPLDPVEKYQPYFTTIVKPVVINQVRGGRVVRYFYVYRMKDCIKVPDALVLRKNERLVSQSFFDGGASVGDLNSIASSLVPKSLSKSLR